MSTNNFIGNIEQFKIGDDFESYYERIEQFFKANNIKDEKKTSLFLTIIGSEAYKIIKNIVLPNKVSDSTYENLVLKLKEYFEPKLNIIYERYIFNKIMQESHESISSYANKLKEQANKCNYGTFLDEALRDKFVNGIKNENILKRLLSEANLTFDKALEIANLLNSASDASKHLKAYDNINKLSYKKDNYKRNNYQTKSDKTIHAKNNKNKENNCRICKRTNHSTENCYFKDKKCFYCNRKGHISKFCYKKNNNKIKELEQQNNEDTQSIDTIKVNKLETVPKIMVPLKIENIICNAEIDTGAAISIMSNDMYNKHFKNIPLEQYNGILVDYSNKRIPIKGVIQINAEFNNDIKKLPLVITRKSSNSFLLGRNWLKLFKIDLHKLLSINEYVKAEDTTTLKKPSEKFLNRKVLGNVISDKGIKPDPDKVKAFTQCPKQKKVRDHIEILKTPKGESQNTCKIRKFQVNDKVYVKSFKKGKFLWKEGIINKTLGRITYMVIVDGVYKKVHLNQMRKRESEEESFPWFMPEPTIDKETISNESSDTPEDEIENSRTKRYPGRCRKPSIRYQ